METSNYVLKIKRGQTWAIFVYFEWLMVETILMILCMNKFSKEIGVWNKLSLTSVYCDSFIQYQLI